MKRIVVGICFVLFFMSIAMGGFYKFGAIPFVAIKDYYGEWHLCNEVNDIFVSSKGLCTKVCPNRKTSWGYCSLACPSPSDKPLMDDKGYCHSCDEIERVYTGSKPCSEICPNRVKTSREDCILPCSSNNPVMSEAGYCSSCNETESIYVGKDGKCTEVCPNRIKTHAGNCVLSCPADKPLMDEDGKCYSCDEIKSVFVDDGKCESICPGRYQHKSLKWRWGGHYGEKVVVNACSLNKCPVNNPLKSEDGSCYSCNETESIEVGKDGPCTEICSNRIKTDGGYCALPCPSDKPLQKYNGECIPCDFSRYEASMWRMGIQEANLVLASNCTEICSNLVKLEDGYCVKKCSADIPLMNEDGECYSCDEPKSIKVGKVGKCSEICSNRVKTDSGDCVLSCPADKPLMDEDGKCYSCDEIKSVFVRELSCETICPNRKIKQVEQIIAYVDCECECGNISDKVNYCEWGKRMQKCPVDKPIGGSDGCFTCDETDSIDVGEDGACTEICPNRVKTVGGYCALPCPANKPLMDEYGKCYSCDETDSIDVGKDGGCAEICPNRIKSSRGDCVLPCPADKPLMDEDGKCYSCDEMESIDVKEDGACTEICPERIKTEAGYCALPCPAYKTLMNAFGRCYFCDETSGIHVGTDGPCTEICPNRVKTEEGDCVLPCPADKPLKNKWGSCWSCDDEKYGICVGKDGECESICHNRAKTENGYCVAILK